MSDKGQESGAENAVGWLILGCVFAALAFLVWYFQGDAIKSGIRWIRYAEMQLVSVFVNENKYEMTFVNSAGTPVNFTMKQALETVPRIPADCDAVPANRRENFLVCLNSQTMQFLNAVALGPMRMIFAGIIALMGIWAYTSGPKSHFRTKYTIDGLIGFQARNFPAIVPFVKFNPSNQPPRPPGSPVPAELPLFAEALGPEEWLAYNSIPIPDGKIDERAAAIAFSKQLGAPWRGAARLPPYKQVLLAAFCLKAARKRNDADAMMGRLAMCWSNSKGFVMNKKLLNEARSILKNKDMSGKTIALCNQHAFQTTALLRALATCRSEGGVMAPAQFVWLRAYDRTLWYPLNNLGRQSYHMEALGAMAHYKIEKLTQRPIPKPKVDGAVTAIREYMNSSKARPVPQLDYSAGGKKAIKKPKTSGGVKKPAKA